MYMIQVEELNVQTSQKKRYYLKDASDNRKPALMNLNTARHLAANIPSDWLVRRYASVVEAV